MLSVMREEARSLVSAYQSTDDQLWQRERRHLYNAPNNVNDSAKPNRPDTTQPVSDPDARQGTEEGA